MPTNYPTALDDGTSLPTKTSGDSVASSETNTQSGAIKAVQAKLGIGSSTPTTGKELGSTASGTTDWRTRAVIDARDYGANPTSGSDEAAHLQSAINACASLGGGVVKLLPGTYLLSTALVISTSGVVIEGAGQDVTILQRTGADTSDVVYIRTTDLANTKITESGLRRLKVDGNTTALYGVHFKTVNYATIDGVNITNCVTYQFLMDCWDTRPGGGDARDNQHADIRNLKLTTTAAQGGASITGNTPLDANTSLCTFRNIFLTHGSSGIGWAWGNSDGCTMEHLRIVYTGSGSGMEFGASGTASAGHARHHVIANIQSAGAGIYGKSGTQPSGPNWITGYNTGNGGSGTPPVAQGSSTLHWLDDTGVITKEIRLLPSAALLDSGTLTSVGSAPDHVQVLQLADAATQGGTWDFEVPLDWDSGTFTVQPVWAPGSTDASSHTVRWQVKCKTRGAGGDVTAAGTATAWTGSSAARTQNLMVKDTSQDTGVTIGGTGNLLAINIRRIGADAADTYVGAVNLLWVVLTYTGKVAN